MQSTEEEPRSPETIIHEAETAIWKDSEYFTAEDVFVLAKALAAERDRADRAEAAIHNAPHSVACRKRSRDIWPCTCWKSEATA